MSPKTACLAVVLLLAGSSSTGLAQPKQDNHPPASRPFKSVFSNFQIHLGLEIAGPVLFADTPDATLESTTTFQYGGRIAFMFGQEILDLHRLGIGVSYDFVAQSDTRELSFVAPYLIYEIGHPLILQVSLGGSVGVGTAGYASNYTGVHTGVALRYSFLRAKRLSPISVSLGLTGKFVFAVRDLRYSSAFVGAQIEIIYHSHNK